MPNMNTRLVTKTELGQRLAPQLQHAIKLLQMNSIELVNKIESEIAENPFLDDLKEIDNKKVKKSDDDRVKPLELDHEKKVNKRDEKEREEIESYFADSSDYGSYSNNNTKSNYTSGSSDSKQAFLEGAVSMNSTFYEELVSQLRLMNISDKEFLIGEAIISSLDEEGYFKVSFGEIAKSLDVKSEDVKNVLKIVQQLEPAGVGARSLQESLLIQIDRQNEEHPVAKEMIIKFLDNLLQQHRYKDIASRLRASKFDVTEEDIIKEARFISTLEPYPARNYQTKGVKYIIPDVTVRKSEEGNFSIQINDDYLPKLGINKYYRKLLSKSKKDVNQKTKEFLDNKYSEAKLLISSIVKRRSTISKVVEKIVDYQMEFFEKGPQYLKPLTLKDIADKIEMHESTISRVTTDKYMDTPWGIVDFKYFFSSGLKGVSKKSSTSIKELIKEIIENESSTGKALTDTKIMEILSNRGIKIARRTVAKYRKALKIMPSYYRKDIGGNNNK